MNLQKIKDSVEALFDLYLNEEQLNLLFEETIEFFDQYSPSTKKITTSQSICEYPKFFHYVASVKDACDVWVSFEEKEDGIHLQLEEVSVPVTIEYFVHITEFDPETTQTHDFKINVPLMKQLYRSKIQLMNTKIEKTILKSTDVDISHLLSEQELANQIEEVEEKVKKQAPLMPIFSVNL